VLGYTCRIVDDHGNDVVSGETGQLLVGGIPGISLMHGYFKDEASTNATLKNGWLSTGDKVPSTIEFVAELPRTSVGKIQKHLLRTPGSSY
jgi:acyl-coenzyme A synthetase/AMP-(fatty) acid ligase